MTTVPVKPLSAVSGWTGTIGVIVLFGALAGLKSFPYPLNMAEQCFYLLGLPAIAMALFDIAVCKVHTRSSTGLIWVNERASVLRAFKDRDLYVKLLGVALTLGLFTFVWSMPTYNEDYFKPFFDFLKYYDWLIVGIGIVYFFSINAAMENRRDGFWHLGALIVPALRQHVDRHIVKTHLLSSAVKIFFLPLMYIFLHQQWDYLKGISLWPHDLKSFFDLSLRGIFITDVAFAVIGYTFTMRLFDAHIRQPEMQWGGWTICLICYAPFNKIVFDRFLNYHDSIDWQNWLSAHPVLYAIWGSLILGTYLIYVAATVNFGLRFSNLTNRGVLTHGMYAYTKHPAYVSKNFGWWMEQVPFIATSATLALKHCLILCIVNYVYYLRAKYEEKTMSAGDDTYARYAAYIDQHGAFARARRLIRKTLNKIPFVKI